MSAEHGASFISIVTVVFMKSAVENVSVIDKLKKKEFCGNFSTYFQGKAEWFVVFIRA